jgi:hypothetical protein
MSREPDLGEKALDKAAEVVLTNQLDQVEQVEVDIRSDPGKVMQGKVDSVAITGEGMVMKQDLRVEAAEIHADSVAINPLKAVFGEIELTQPTKAQAQILLTEADLNRALASDYLRDRMKNLQIEAQGQSTTIDIQRVNVHLPGDHKLALDVDIRVNEASETKQFSAVARPFLQDNGQRIEFEVLSAEGKGLALDFITALFTKIIELLDLRKFDLNGTVLQLKDLEALESKLLLRATALVEQLPTD